MGMTRSHSVHLVCIALAGSLVAAPASAAADYFLKLDGVKGEARDDKHKGEIEIASFSWGTTRHADALTDGLLIVRYHTDPPPPAAATGAGATGQGAGKVNVHDISVMRGPRQTTSADGVQVAAGDVDGDGRADTAAAGKFGAVSGAHRDESMGSGKRTHPALIKISKPLETGSITLRTKLPGCAVGARYPAAELTTPQGRYTLQDLVVASSGGGGGGGAGGAAPTEQVTLNYAKVKVRAWDPSKKEE